MSGMLLPIGDFARATLLTVKTLRHYHQAGLLEPADIDPRTGYRRYTAEQIPAAQVIRRLRDLGMPLEQVRGVLTAPGPNARADLLANHLARLEGELDRTRLAVTALRDLLDGPPQGEVEVRGVPATRALAIREVVDASGAGLWLQGALGELYAVLEAQGAAADGPPGGVYADEVFTHHRGEATVYLPCPAGLRPAGRVVETVLPAVELAVITHAGPPEENDRAYGMLAAHVARHALAVAGPVREHYLVGRRETADRSRWRTEIGWPVFATGRSPRVE
ncbi:MerR family transcriptional regulator [Kitasatospora viridis]|uniref:DNA-binding transcriptional MerR regulator n=1 Tax=Kitasatospora viridis TaxID=281105 RepID=A0A561UHC2_9ACTN|nr:MerR family transcriptional regulator [Kitasatospora viridis]TWF98752.1 DNA-binding transcriptional MerR regulator [Kitasatospora viridis]